MLNRRPKARDLHIDRLFAHTAPDLLRRYFESEQLPKRFYLNGNLLRTPQELSEAWVEDAEIGSDDRVNDLQEVYNLATEKGTAIIRDVGRRLVLQNLGDGHKTFASWLAARGNQFDRALATFLDYPDVWHQSVGFFNLDAKTYWRKRDGLPSRPPVIAQHALDALAGELGQYLHEHQARGINSRAKAEYVPRDSHHYFFVIGQDYPTSKREWLAGDQLAPITRRPSLEIAFLYCQEEGRLEMHFRGDEELSEKAELAFGAHILETDLTSIPYQRSYYTLNVLKSPNFCFQIDPDDGIASAEIRQLRFSMIACKNQQFTVDLGNNPQFKDIYDMLDSTIKEGVLDACHVSQVEFVIRMTDIDKPITVRITHPNFNSLECNDLSARISRMLARSGIERRLRSGDAKRLYGDDRKRVIRKKIQQRARKATSNNHST